METDENTGIDLSLYLDAFNTIVSAMKSLDREDRIRLLTAIAVLFDLPLPSARSMPSRIGEAPLNPIASTTGSFSEDRSQSPKEFLFEKQPQTDMDRVACLAYYLAHYRGTPHFKTLDISKLNTEAAQLKFSNATKTVDNALRAGLLVPASKGQKQLSAAGERYVQALPDKTAARAALVRARPKRRIKMKGSDEHSEESSDSDESSDQ
jgi:hypothetical protein